MKRILFIFILLMGISQASNKDGIFLGFELGLGEVKTTESFNSATNNVTASLPLYGFRLGYVKYFGDLFGIYTYANFKDLFQSTKSDREEISIHIMSFAANIDFLLNFYNDKFLFMGGFAGIGIGSANIKSRINGFSDNLDNLYTDFKLGLKTIYEHNSISLIASFPVIPIKRSIFVGQGLPSYDSKLRTNYTISLAYDYKF